MDDGGCVNRLASVHSPGRRAAKAGARRREPRGPACEATARAPGRRGSRGVRTLPCFVLTATWKPMQPGDSAVMSPMPPRARGRACAAARLSGTRQLGHWRKRDTSHAALDGSTRGAADRRIDGLEVRDAVARSRAPNGRLSARDLAELSERRKTSASDAWAPRRSGARSIGLRSNAARRARRHCEATGVLVRGTRRHVPRSLPLARPWTCRSAAEARC